MSDWIIISAVLVVGGTSFAFGKWCGNVDPDRKSFQEFMPEIRGNIEEIGAKVEEIFRRMPPSPRNMKMG